MVFCHLAKSQLGQLHSLKKKKKKIQTPNKAHKPLNNQVNNFPIDNQKAREKSLNRIHDKSVMTHKEWIVILLLIGERLRNNYEGGAVDKRNNLVSCRAVEGTP